ncbi:MAG: alpha/beta hydrolase [Bacteroidales bacterium]|nr:alpha/beta hydrolase [Bacteroidales bacterium]
MKTHSLIYAAATFLLASCGGATQQQSAQKEVKIPENQIVLENGGSGDFKAVMFEDSTLTAHTVFCPKDLSKFSKENPLPVLVWGNGACNNSPHEHINFLNEIASHGYLVVATGYMPHDTVIYKGAISKSSQQIESVDWAIAQNSDKNSYLFDKVDTKNIAAAGMSCGGLQTLFNCADPRFKTLMICNSGLFINPVNAMPDMPMPPKEKLEEIHTPVIYILGGKEDIAYENGMDDFHRITKQPAFAANFPVGHGGTYSKPFGGEFSVVALAWLDWQLKGDEEAAKMFKGDNPLLGQRENWTIEKNELIDK